MEPPRKVLAKLIAARAEYDRLHDACAARCGELFLETRREMGLGQRAMADRLGIHYTYVSQIENGKQRPGMPVLERLHELVKETKR